ncbi:hypothetical protein SAMN03159290_05043 [Pseudomonas sp. NFACC13-1]|nr:hypothetical protein SAMN03159290_05043 [Pseudomonas sp. NFACC13-1]
MAQRGYLGIHAEVPTTQCLRSASVVNGAQIKSQREAACQPAWLSLSCSDPTVGASLLANAAL